jgi:hypothetical protein
LWVRDRNETERRWTGEGLIMVTEGRRLALAVVLSLLTIIYVGSAVMGYVPEKQGRESIG